MFEAETKIRVRYAETDQMGYVYYGNYALYYEVGRIETLRQLGFAYKKMEDSGVMMPVLECNTKYHTPGKYDDLLTIKVKIPTMPRAKILFEYEIYNEDQTLLNSGQTTLAFVTMATNKPSRIPEDLANLLKPHFDA